MGYRLQLDLERFLKDHWQREHCYMPAGFPAFKVPADADELAGLAMEATADGRMICGGAGSWSLHRGPLTEQDYRRTGPWSLLVHGVDHHWEEAAELLHAIPGLPSWRLDDVMMSYATDGGSAGPHFDHYDVFIIQGEGQRRWQIGQFCDDSLPADPSGLSLLADFACRHEYLMECGDVLYVPPRCAHYGVSVGESTSFSIGFRAPRLSDLLARLTDNRLEALGDRDLLTDGGRDPAHRAGEISDADIARARTQLLDALQTGDDSWFGEAITAAGVSDPAEPVPSPPSLGPRTRLRLAPGRRLAWKEDAGRLLVFSAGTTREAPQVLQSVLEALCRGEELVAETALAAHGAAGQLVQELLQDGTMESYDD